MDGYYGNHALDMHSPFQKKKKEAFLPTQCGGRGKMNGFLIVWFGVCYIKPAW